jgi:ribulose-phosphate 3-epimerase
MEMTAAEMQPFRVRSALFLRLFCKARRFFTMQNIKTSASILSADMCHLAAVTEQLEQSGTDMLHFDVMDGIFVENISFGIPVLSAIRKKTNLFLDVHLMITNPLRYVSRFAEAGADGITFHLESLSDPQETIDAIHACGIPAGIVIKPATPAEAVLPYLSKVEAVLVMTVEPGFGGQSFLWDMLEKVRFLRKAATEQGLQTVIQVDGGINAETAPEAVAAGADNLVVGSYLFKQENLKTVIDSLHQLSTKAN